MDHAHHHHHHQAAMETSTSAAINASNMITDTSADACGQLDSGHHMQMYFHFGYCEVVLFQFWQIRSIGDLILSMVIIMMLAAAYEGLKSLREYLYWKSTNMSRYSNVNQPEHGSEEDEDKKVSNMIGPEVIHRQPSMKMLSSAHGLQTFLHIIQMTLSYLLMLIFMTFNVWLSAAVIIGAGIGYFSFAWKKTLLFEFSDHCH